MNTTQIVAPFFGALLLEVVHWYGLRDKLYQQKYKRALRSPGYWLITVLMIALGPIGALIIYEDATPAGLLIAGAAFPSVFKKIVGAFIDKSVKLGSGDEQAAPPLSAYFSA